MIWFEIQFDPEFGWTGLTLGISSMLYQWRYTDSGPVCSLAQFVILFGHFLKLDLFCDVRSLVLQTFGSVLPKFR